MGKHNHSSIIGTMRFERNFILRFRPRLVFTIINKTSGVDFEFLYIINYSSYLSPEYGVYVRGVGELVQSNLKKDVHAEVVKGTSVDMVWNEISDDSDVYMKKALE